MKKIIVKIEWDVRGLTPAKMLEGIKWYLKDLKGKNTIKEVKSIKKN